MFRLECVTRAGLLPAIADARTNTQSAKNLSRAGLIPAYADSPADLQKIEKSLTCCPSPGICRPTDRRSLRGRSSYSRSYSRGRDVSLDETIVEAAAKGDSDGRALHALQHLHPGVRLLQRISPSSGITLCSPRLSLVRVRLCSTSLPCR